MQSLSLSQPNQKSWPVANWLLEFCKEELWSCQDFSQTLSHLKDSSGTPAGTSACQTSQLGYRELESLSELLLMISLSSTACSPWCSPLRQRRPSCWLMIHALAACPASAEGGRAGLPHWTASWSKNSLIFLNFSHSPQIWFLSQLLALTIRETAWSDFQVVPWISSTTWCWRLWSSEDSSSRGMWSSS